MVWSLAVNKWIIWYAVFLHIAWGCALLQSESPLGVTAIHHIGIMLPGRWTSAVGLIMIGTLAGIGLLTNDRMLSLIVLLPQQFVLMLSALGAIVAIYHSTFADGVVRPRAFIFTDQMPAVLAAIFHTCALLEAHGRESLDRIRAKWRAE